MAVCKHQNIRHAYHLTTGVALIEYHLFGELYDYFIFIVLTGRIRETRYVRCVCACVRVCVCVFARARARFNVT
jgi:hypothetical protein